VLLCPSALLEDPSSCFGFTTLLTWRTVCAPQLQDGRLVAAAVHAAMYLGLSCQVPRPQLLCHPYYMVPKAVNKTNHNTKGTAIPNHAYKK